MASDAWLQSGARTSGAAAVAAVAPLSAAARTSGSSNLWIKSTAVVVDSGAATLQGSSSFSASGTVIDTRAWFPSARTVSGTAALTAIAPMSAGALASGSADLWIKASPPPTSTSGAATLSGASSLYARAVDYAHATLTASSTLYGDLKPPNKATLVTGSTFKAVPTDYVKATLTASSTLYGNGVPAQSGKATLTGGSTFSGTATPSERGQATLTASSSVQATGTVLYQASGHFITGSTLYARSATFGRATLISNSVLKAVPTDYVKATLTASSTLYAKLAGSPHGAATLTASSTLNPPLTRTNMGAATLTAVTIIRPPVLIKVSLAAAFFAGALDISAFSAVYKSANPITDREPYRLVVVDMYGTRYGELNNATITSITWALPDKLGNLVFSLSNLDLNYGLLALPQQLPEIQVWKGTQIIWWGVLPMGKATGTTTEFTAYTLEWYFAHRVMGLLPTKNLLTNPGFEDNEAGWTFTYTPDSIPATFPEHHITTAPDQVLDGTKALEMTGSSLTLHSNVGGSNTYEADVMFGPDLYVLDANGQSVLDGLLPTILTGSTVVCTGHTALAVSAYNLYDLSLWRAQAVMNYMKSKRADLIITAVGVGPNNPVATNDTEAGRAQNRRTVVDYNLATTTLQGASGHRQYAVQSTIVNNPVVNRFAKLMTFVGWTHIITFDGPARDGWGLYMEMFDDTGASRAYVFAPVDITTPRNRWIRLECALQVPPDGRDYRLETRLYPVAGSSVFDDVSLTGSDELNFFEIDQAQIVKGLVEHAQDVSLGKSTLNIGTSVKDSGVLRSREYPYSERKLISEALNEWPNLGLGIDWYVEFTPTKREVVTYYPRRVRRGYTLALGSNVADFSVDIDNEQASTVILVQTDGNGSSREEGYARDTSGFGGMVLEKVYTSTPGSALSSLNAQAQRGLRRYRKPIVVPTLYMNTLYTDELLERVRVGDVVTVKVQRGSLLIDGLYRITKQTLNPNTEQIEYTVTPEDDTIGYVVPPDQYGVSP